jgi:hypothetical protein
MAYSFVSEHKLDDLFDMHRLVHIATWNWLNKENKLSACAEMVLMRLADVFPDVDHENRTMWSICLTHVRFVLPQRCLSIINETILALLPHIVRKCLISSDHYREGEQMHCKALELRKRASGPENAHT